MTCGRRLRVAPEVLPHRDANLWAEMLGDTRLNGRQPRSWRPWLSARSVRTRKGERRCDWPWPTGPVVRVSAALALAVIDPHRRGGGPAVSRRPKSDREVSTNYNFLRTERRALVALAREFPHCCRVSARPPSRN